MRQVMLWALTAMLLVWVAGGCTSVMRWEPSQAVKENAATSSAAAERLATLSATQDQVTPAMRKLANAAAAGFRSAISYIGLPKDTSFLDTVRALESENAEEQAAAAAKAEALATTAATEGAARPTPSDVVDEANRWTDALLDNADVWLPILGLGSLSVYTALIRKKKDEALAALKTTVQSVEKTPGIPAAFYERQGEKLTDAQAAVIAELGGTGPTPAAVYSDK